MVRWRCGWQREVENEYGELRRRSGFSLTGSKPSRQADSLTYYGITTTHHSFPAWRVGRRAVLDVAFAARPERGESAAARRAHSRSNVAGSGIGQRASPCGSHIRRQPTVRSAPRPLDGAQFTSVEQVLRFDVTKEWVYQNWDRKSTGPTDVGLFSVRVPLVMGTQMTALAGSLTYYFNAQGQVEHISFRGRTGDTTQLVQFLTRYYQFQPVSSPTGEQVYQVGNGEQRAERAADAAGVGAVVELRRSRASPWSWSWRGLVRSACCRRAAGTADSASCSAGRLAQSSRPRPQAQA